MLRKRWVSSGEGDFNQVSVNPYLSRKRVTQELCKRFQQRYKVSRNSLNNIVTWVSGRGSLSLHAWWTRVFFQRLPSFTAPRPGLGSSQEHDRWEIVFTSLGWLSFNFEFHLTTARLPLIIQDYKFLNLFIKLPGYPHPNRFWGIKIAKYPN